MKDLNALPRNFDLAIALPTRDSQFPLTLQRRHIRADTPFAVRAVCPEYRHNGLYGTARYRKVIKSRSVKRN